MSDSEEIWEDALSEFEEEENDFLDYYNKKNPKIVRKSLFTLPEYNDLENEDVEEGSSKNNNKKKVEPNENKQKEKYLNDIKIINEKARNLTSSGDSSSTINEINSYAEDNNDTKTDLKKDKHTENLTHENDSDNDFLPVHRKPPIDLRNEDFNTENLMEKDMKKNDSQETLNELNEIRDLEKEIDNLLKCTPEEIEKLKESAKMLKEAGNQYFKKGEYRLALNEYKKASEICPKENKEDLAIYYNNMAACYVHIGTYEDVKKHCDKALENNPDYLKALIRRANINEKIGKVYSLTQAIEDHKKILLLDPSFISSEASIRRLQTTLTIQQEKEKEEMLEKFKDVGNKLLGKLGLSLDNFKLQQNESGGYSINMNQNN